jgi:hypothetical protein
MTTKGEVGKKQKVSYLAACATPSRSSQPPITRREIPTQKSGSASKIEIVPSLSTSGFPPGTKTGGVASAESLILYYFSGVLIGGAFSIYINHELDTMEISPRIFLLGVSRLRGSTSYVLKSRMMQSGEFVTL